MCFSPCQVSVVQARCRSQREAYNFVAFCSGAILFGIANAFVPVILALCIADLSGVFWSGVLCAVVLISVVSTFLGLFIAVSVKEVFEAQTFSNFFRFPMIFLCGMFFPVEQLPVWLQPLSYLLPITYGVDALHQAVNQAGTIKPALDIGVLLIFGCGLFIISLRNIRKKWIL
jgi:ABC-2 type transport system permease protein